MKPAFALDFRNDAIALLHRTSGGWHQVGRVTLDEPDLPGALSYLRATALGLSPRGLATKLILPDDQILVTSVDAPGPDDATRQAQIRAALEGRTPYPVEDLVFDWEEVNGEVHVAVIARETLAEAEAFATEHRFNPVAFAAAPATGFVGEPWFGPTAQAADLLAPGETVEREADQMLVIARAVPTDADTPQAAEAAPADLTAAEDASAPANTAPDDNTPDDSAAQDVSDPIGDLPPDADPAPADSWQDGADTPGEVVPAAAEPAPVAPPAWQPPPLPPRGTPIFGLADDEPPPSTAIRAQAGWTDTPAASPDFAQDTPADSPPTDSSPTDNPLPDDLAAALQDIVLEEAPMAVDVEDDAPSPAPAATPRLGVTDPSIADDVPPVPGYSPAMGFASRRASADGGQAAKVATPPAPRPTVDRPTAARPLVAPPAPKPERPALNRPTAARPLVAPKETKGLRGLGAMVTAPGLPGAGKKKVMPPASSPATAPVAPSTAAPAPMAAPGPAAPPQTPATEPAKGLGRSLGSRPAPVRGKPRHLGLILTGLLLLILALVAAWSTSLAFRSDEGAATELAAANSAPPDPAVDPAVEDEMLADGEDPGALTDAAAPPATEPPAESEVEAAIEPPAAVEAQDATPQAPPPNPGASSGDEIFLAAKDQAPVAPEPLDLPEVSAQGDPLPAAQAPPPPFGTVYQFDANGLIVPTPEGIITPEGVRLVAGKPPLVPKPRPEGLTPAQPDPAAALPETTAETAVETVVSDPALAGFRPKARPATLTPPAQTAPADALPAEPLPDDAALPPAADSRLAGLRPLARPEAVLAAGDAARAATAAAAASLAAQAEAAAAPTSKLAVAISRKPAARPRDLSRAVEAAVAAAVRAPDPKPEPEPQPEPEQLASVQPAKSPQPKAKPEEQEDKAAAKSPTRGKDAEVEADQEPELAASARSAPSGSVAKQATFKNALNLEKTALIGVYGTPSNRYAMIRTSNGRYKKVKIGDSVDGGRIKAITATEVRYQKGAKLVTLALPKG